MYCIIDFAKAGDPRILEIQGVVWFLTQDLAWEYYHFQKEELMYRNLKVVLHLIRSIFMNNFPLLFVQIAWVDRCWLMNSQQDIYNENDKIEYLDINEKIIGSVVFKPYGNYIYKDKHNSLDLSIIFEFLPYKFCSSLILALSLSSFILLAPI